MIYDFPSSLTRQCDGPFSSDQQRTIVRLLWSSVAANDVEHIIVGRAVAVVDRNISKQSVVA